MQKQACSLLSKNGSVDYNGLHRSICIVSSPLKISSTNIAPFYKEDIISLNITLSAHLQNITQWHQHDVQIHEAPRSVRRESRTVAH